MSFWKKIANKLQFFSSRIFSFYLIHETDIPGPTHFKLTRLQDLFGTWISHNFTSFSRKKILLYMPSNKIKEMGLFRKCSKLAFMNWTLAYNTCSSTVAFQFYLLWRVKKKSIYKDIWVLVDFFLFREIKKNCVLWLFSFPSNLITI